MRAAATPFLSSGILTDVGRQRRGRAELAANLALDTLSQGYLGGRGSPTVRLAEAMQAANLAVLRHAVGEYVGMGTTLLALLVDRGAGLIAHVGDSRAYLLRGGELHRLTDDHSWVAEQVRLGNLSEEEAQQHQWRSVVSNALGGEERVRLELFGLPLRAGDRLLLCSDGLSGAVTDAALLDLLQRPQPPDQLVQSLVNAANDAGGADNITAIVVDVLRDQRLPHYPLPPRPVDGPLYVDLLLSAQRGSSPLTYLLLILAYFTLLGMILVPEFRTVIGLLGVALLGGVLVLQRLTRARMGRPPPPPEVPRSSG